MVVGASYLFSRHALKPHKELVKTLEGAWSLALWFSGRAESV